MMALEARPRLVRFARLKHDRVRDRWLLLAPERGLVLNRTALAIVQSFGEGTLAEIATRVAPGPAAAGEVVAFVRELGRRGLVEVAP